MNRTSIGSVSPLRRLPLWGPALVTGFGTAVAMWVAGFVTHIPAIRFDPSLAGPILLAIQLIGITLGSRAAGRERAVPVGLLAGLLTALVNLLVLGTQIAQPLGDGAAPAATGLRPDAATLIAGFAAISVAIGFIGGAIGRATASSIPPIDPARWPARFSVVSVVSAAPLLLLGGLVTSTGSGLAVPDWPGTYGANMFLYPISLMSSPQVYLEHSHRLFGALVGLVTLVQTIYVWKADRRGGVRLFALTLFVAVCVQGYLGGTRVTEKSQWLAVFHGMLAQVFFAGLVALAVMLAPSFRTSSQRLGTLGRVRTLALLLLGAMFLQLVFGAMYRHLHNMHALWSHAGFSLAVVVLAILTGFSMSARLKESDPIDPVFHRVARSARGLIHTVGFQFLLGWAAFYLVLASKQHAVPPTPVLPEQLATAPPIGVLESAVRTIHQANGALLLALATLCVVWAFRFSRAASPEASAGRST